MTLHFFASMTAAPSEVRKIENYLERASPEDGALAHVLTTPLFMNQEALGIIKRFQDKRGSEICFDSAGYYVQVGKIQYHELYMKLLTCYRNHRWADRYVLPDYVPLSSDTDAEVEEKVQQTVYYSCLFFQEMPDELKPKAMPVVHGRTRKQVEYCLEHYLTLGIEWVGFGSFGTFGKNNETNIATQSAVDNARLVVNVAKKYGLKVHLFGLGAPALVGMLHSIGADSFDSASWFKSAGFGQVHMPFGRGYNITYNNGRSTIQKGITWEDFTQLKEVTGHTCLYCTDYQTISSHKMHRVVHNLLVVNESVQMLNQGEFDRARSIYEQGSVKYKEEYKRWLPLVM